MMAEDKRPTLKPEAQPINLGLNEGTHCPTQCIDAIQTYNCNTDLRNYTSAGNEPLLDVISEVDGVNPENIFLHNGSGPILKLAMRYHVARQIKSSPIRIAKHLLTKNGYPIITPSFTYSKVPIKGAESRLTVRFVEVSPDNGFTLDPDQLRRQLDRGDGIVYITNPNNPTGNVLMGREDLIDLLKTYPKSTFWLDEAYVQYLDYDEHRPLSDLVPHHDNLIVTRSFSFAYGLAGMRIGYLLSSPEFIDGLNSEVVDYRIGALQQDVAIAALRSPDHLPFIRQYCAEQRAIITEGIQGLDHIEVYPSQTNFLLCRRTDGRLAKTLCAAMADKGILIKQFKSIQHLSYPDYFRLTLGLPKENQLLIKTLAEVWD